MATTVSAASSTDLSNYIMSNSNQIKSMRYGGRFNQSIILTYTDTSEWVFLNDTPKERFCGFLYLQDAIKKAGLSTIRAADNKMALHDKKIIYLSRYCGEIKPNEYEFLDPLKFSEFSILKNKIGFVDMLGSANIRKKNDKIYVFDTEKLSFHSSVRKNIDSFVELHDKIKAHLEERLKSEN